MMGQVDKQFFPLSVVIVSEGKRTLISTLACLARLSQSVVCQVVLVMDVSNKSAQTFAFLSKFDLNLFFPKNHLSLIAIKENLSNLSEGRNIGVNHCNSNIIIFLDDDVLLSNDFLIEITNSFQNEKAARLMVPSYFDYINTAIYSNKYSLTDLLHLSSKNLSVDNERVVADKYYSVV